LQVHPFAGLVERGSSSVPRLLINREAVGPFVRVKHGKRKGRDGVYLGDADDAVRELVRAIGWEDELDALIEEGQKRLESEWKAMGAAEGGDEEEAEESESKEKEQEIAKEEQAEAAAAVEAKEAKEAEEKAAKDVAKPKLAEDEPLQAKAKAIEAEVAKDAALEDEVEALTAGIAGVKVDEKKADEKADVKAGEKSKV
jgi:ParB-like chromosome segregation protein Spo0J